MREARVYLDYQSTTPLDNRVYEAMLPYLKDNFGNPSSRFHSYGWAAREAVNRSRKLIASVFNVQSREIIFTSGATESNNTAIRGIVEKYGDRGNHIITCGTEHKSVLSTCQQFEKQGFRTTYLPVNTEGLIDIDDLSRAISDSTILISLMAANNEIGVTHPLKEIGHLAKTHGVIFHSDATQAIGKLKLDVQELGIDLLTLSGHKIYGPKGIGILYIRSDKPHVQITPLLHGGGQEGGMRSGTLNVPAIVGLAKAIELCEELSSEEVPRLRKLRDALVHGITKNIQDISINGSLEYRIPNNLNISFRGIEAQALLMMMDDIALSLGSACHEQSIEPSHVLRALNIPDDDIYSAVRFGLGRFTSDADIAYTIDRVTETVHLLRSRNTSRTQNKKETA
jgi:cysteine desulfurase